MTSAPFKFKIPLHPARTQLGNVVGHENIVSASRMNSAIVVFLNDVEKVRKLTQNGIVGNNETILVSPLSSPDKKVMLCNVPPLISDEAIGKELSRYGRMVSPIKKIPLGCKSPLTLSVLNVVRLDISLGPAPRGRVTPVFLSDRGGKRPSRPDREKPWSTEKSSVGSGAVLEPPALTEAGAEVQGDRMETPDTTPVQGDGGDVDMADEPVFKVPNKRKKQGKGRGKKQARKETKVEEGESDSDDRISDSVLTFDSQEEQINVVHSAEDIKEFLRNTKWQKNVALEEFFPDHKHFIHDVKFFRREAAFIHVEIFRLKKLITRVNRENSDHE
ncbi:hypothetical protein QTP70_013774 [Hemibagrus guttatus]|uniref:Uncharacterized protein n=1 Tax=Hemibagrus guttatus TaxID=175788 RepID=A0AAE0R707_9TELE|nr:hypothetical protein QTP70_013774 [Hemibagrus guttatus]